jgi:processive 1,2-diacylglycerol beta-glucosyltransferase
VKVNMLPLLSYKVDSLLADPARLAQLRANAVRLARPNAAFDVAAKALQFVRKK